jgi:signal transduction histidine kinase
VRVEVARHGNRARVAVCDQGAGIPADEQHAVFQRFVRGAGARASGIAGTGIGLTLAHQIVAAHGGEIRIESEPGRGSTFTIVLPAGSP